MERIVAFPGLGLEFTFKNAIQIGPITISIYGMLIATGLLLGILYLYKTCKKTGIDVDKVTDVLLGGIVGGIVGARLYYVAFSWDQFGFDSSSGEAFWQSFLRLFKTWEGGMAIYGGIIGALLVGIIIAKRKKIHIRSLLDITGVGFLIGQAIGRWGNFFNVEAFGVNTDLPWGMTSPTITNYLYSKMGYFSSMGVQVDPLAPVHPTFLYESIWCFIGVILLGLYMKHKKFDGEVFLMYIAFYGAERFVVEGLRADSLMIGSLRVSQILALVLFLVATIIIVVIRIKIKNKNDENYLRLFATTPEGINIINSYKTNKIPELSDAKSNLDEDKNINKDSQHISVKDDITELDINETCNDIIPDNLIVQEENIKEEFKEIALEDGASARDKNFDEEQKDNKHKNGDDIDG